MIEPSPIPGALLVPARDEAKAYLRIEHADEDALFDRLIADATALAEAFTAWALGKGTLASAVSRSRDRIRQDDYAY